MESYFSRNIRGNVKIDKKCSMEDGDKKETFETDFKGILWAEDIKNHDNASF